MERKIATYLTPKIKEFVKEKWSTNYYDFDPENMFFHYPNNENFEGFEVGNHTSNNLAFDYTLVSEQEFLDYFNTIWNKYKNADTDVKMIFEKPIHYSQTKGVMSEDEFEEQVNFTLDSLRKTLIVKGREYRRNQDPFHNFHKGMEITGKSREDVIWGFALKHFVSIQDIKSDLNNGIKPTLSTVNEKYNDLLIYLLIEKISIIDKILEDENK